MHNERSLHGTRIISDEPTIDQEIIAIPAAFQIPTTQEVLQLAVTDYNRISSPEGKVYALGRLATRTLNSFFIINPQRKAPLRTRDLQRLWISEHVTDIESSSTTPQLRGIETLNAIRADIDSQPFIHSTARGRGRDSKFAIAPDIIFVDER